MYITLYNYFVWSCKYHVNTAPFCRHCHWDFWLDSTWISSPMVESVLTTAGHCLFCAGRPSSWKNCWESRLIWPVGQSCNCNSLLAKISKDKRGNVTQSMQFLFQVGVTPFTIIAFLVPTDLVPAISVRLAPHVFSFRVDALSRLQFAASV